jgi:hypothetical protein
MVSCGAWVPIGDRLGWWTPIAERTALVPAAVLAVLAVATLLPARRLLRWAGHLLEQTNGEVVVVYVITVGAALAVAFLIVVR